MTGEQERVEVDLPSDLSAPSSAREEVRSLLRRWRLADLLDPVLLTVSELVTNAVRYGRAPVRMSLRRCSSGVAVGVHDGLPVLDRPDGPPSDDAESGRGLVLVQACADQTGVRQDGDGKVVWARFDAPADTRP